MNDLNRTSVLGYVGEDPDVYTFKNGSKRASFNIATTNRYKDDDGAEQSKTQWHRASAFNKAADVVAENVKKGMRVLVEGPMEYRDYEKDGVKRTAAEIILRGAPGERLDFLSRPKAPQPA